MAKQKKSLKDVSIKARFKLPPNLLPIASIVLTWRIILEAAGQFISTSIQPSGGPESSIIGVRFGFARWMRWDGTWYLSIVNSGYHHHVAAVIQQENIAFYPVFPFMVRLVHDIIRIPYAYAGVLLNFVVTVAMCYFGYLLYDSLKRKYGKVADRKNDYYLPVLFILALPTAFFFAAFYAEAILVFCLVASMYFAVERRYWWAAIFAGIATGTKVIGVIAAPVILILFIEQEHIFRYKLAEVIKKYGLKLAGLMTLSVSGVLVYMAYLWIKYGNPLLSYEDNQAPGWGRKIGGFFIANIFRNYRHVFDPRAYGTHMNYLVNLTLLAMPVVAFLLVVYALSKKAWWIATYAFIMIMIPLSTGSLMSINRLALVLAPCFIFVLASLNRTFNLVYVYSFIAIMATIEIILTSFFLQGTYFIG